MKCEYCLKNIDGSFGSGRFCSRSCANGFATKNKRKEINENVSKILKGRPSVHSKETMQEIGKKVSNSKLVKYDNMDTENILSSAARKRKVLKEQNDKCLHCTLSVWLNKPMKFELHHVDGNSDNNTRINLEVLCPNCHSFTDSWNKQLRFRCT